MSLPIGQYKLYQNSNIKQYNLAKKTNVTWQNINNTYQFANPNKEEKITIDTLLL